MVAIIFAFVGGIIFHPKRGGVGDASGRYIPKTQAFLLFLVEIAIICWSAQFLEEKIESFLYTNIDNISWILVGFFVAVVFLFERTFYHKKR